MTGRNPDIGESIDYTLIEEDLYKRNVCDIRILTSLYGDMQGMDNPTELSLNLAPGESFTFYTVVCLTDLDLQDIRTACNYAHEFYNSGFDQSYYTSSETNTIPDYSDIMNYPNPFNPSTTISFRLPSDPTEETELVIYNIKGQRIKKLTNTFTHQPTNRYSVTWDGLDETGKPVSSGLYCHVLRVNNKMSSSK